MSEVSCRVFDIVLRDLSRRQIDPGFLVQETQLNLGLLRDKNARIPWTQYLLVMQNLARVYSDEDHEALGHSFYFSPLIAPFSLVARVLFELRDFYRFLGTARTGAGGQLFTCVSPSFEVNADDQVTITLTTMEGFTPCRGFFLITKGSFSHAPRLFGMSPCEVKLSIEGQSGRYEIRVPKQRSWYAAARGLFARPFATRRIARELDHTHDELVTKYQELDRAKQTITRQARALETAHNISNRVHATFDLDRALEVVADALIESGGFSFARLELEGGAKAVERQLESEAPSARVEAVLQGRQRVLGRMFVSGRAAQDPDDLEQLLRYVVPVVSVAIEEAAAYDELEAYRDQLEEKVAIRTQELSDARDRLTETVAQLQEAQTARDRFFANINHEIRNPLTLIALAARRLGESEAARAPETQALLQSVDVNVSRLLSLVDGLLLLAASSETKLRVHKKDLDLVEIMRRLTSSFVPKAEDAGIKLETELPTELRALVDEAALERIAANLLSNALKFTPSGGTVRLRLGAEGEDCVLSIEDTGVGLSAEFQARVFGRFEQGLAPVRPGERGSGIGLAIVQELARLHDGTASAEPNPGGGSIFRVRFPRRAGDAAPVESGGSSALARVSLSPDRAKRVSELEVPALLEPAEAGAATILVAEDEPFLLAEIARSIARKFRVLTAPNGEVALELARKHQPAALVSDVSMPGMSGFELARKFRAEIGDRLAPILFVTAHGNISHRLEGFEAGGVDYVLKPFHPDELLARVTAQMEQRSLAMRMEESERLTSLGYLTAGIAHEFRNPANAVINAIIPLKRMLPPSSLEAESPARLMLEVIERGATQLQSLSQQILGLATGGEVISSEPRTIAELLDRAIELLGSTLEGVEIRREGDAEAWLEAAPYTLSQALANLLENAAHAIGGGGWIAVELERTAEGRKLRVSDSGPGVPPALRARIFEPFFTTKDPGRGTGLGLPAVLRAIEPHGGTVRLVERGGGTAFEITLPAQPAATAEPKNNLRRARPEPVIHR